MEKTERIERGCAAVILAIITAIFLSICIRFVVKNVIYEGMGIYNDFVLFWLPDDNTVNEEKTSSDEQEEVQVEIDWERLYPFGNGDIAETGAKYTKFLNEYEANIKSVEDKLDLYTNGLLLFQKWAVTFDEDIKAAFDLDIRDYTDKDEIIFMNNGYLTYPQPKVSHEDIREIAKSITDFKKFLDSRNIPLVYANAGSKVCPYDREITIPSIENTNENADALLLELENSGVDTLDYRDEMIKNGLDWYGAYYKADHHWTTVTGLWAAGIMAEKLNEDYGFSFDKKYFKPDSYNIRRYPRYWFGGQGRKVTLSRAELDDYELILPSFKTDFSISIPTRAITLSGAYKDVLFDMKTFTDIARYTNNEYLNKKSAYECAMIRNDANSKIHNNRLTNNQDKKILMIQDSFSWYSTSYMACDVEDIDILYIKAFNGSVKNYIEKEKPDIVIIMYCERQIKPIEWEGHESPFDFR